MTSHRRDGPRWRADDRGESMIELLVTVAVMVTAVVVLVGGLATAIVVSDRHRKQAAAGVQVRAFAEAVEKEVNKSPTGYVDCATTATYRSLFTAETGFTREVVQVRYWNGTAFAASCGTDQGVQRVSLRISSTDGRAAESLDVIIRKPCRAGDPPCA